MTAVAGSGLFMLAVRGDQPASAQNGASVRPALVSSSITTTAHAPLPTHVSRYWLVPDDSSVPAMLRQNDSAAFARGVLLVQEGRFDSALPLVRAARLSGTPLQHYARYFTAAALLGLNRPEEAAAALSAIPDSVEGYLREAARLRSAEAALAGGDAAEAADILDDLSDDALLVREDVLLRLAEALETAGEPARALQVYYRLYYEFPLGPHGVSAQTAIERLQNPSLVPPNRFELELGRAERLFDNRRWAQARAGFAGLLPTARKADADRIALRVAECDYHLGRHAAARDALRDLARGSDLEAEARFYLLSATRALGDTLTYGSLVRGLVEDHPESRWAEEALNNQASHFITLDDEAAADRIFRELARRFPRGRYADRAAWKIGWRAYKQGDFAEAATTFEAAAGAFPRADYRPSWLYWAARSRDQQGERAQATALYRITAADYLNSYYGRRASALLAARGASGVTSIVAMGTPIPPGLLVPTEPVIRALVALELYDAALNEVEYARQQWGDSAALQASVAGIRHRRALQAGATDRFADLRGAITMMRRAYPQFMAAGGEQLPREVLRVIFPLDFWPLIKKYSDAHALDPYLMTALIAQESTFTPDVRSSANAVGLMQLIPGTGRRVARQLGIRYAPSILTQPETNIRLGMRYFKDLMVQFGAPAYALAGYNAGERRVVRWRAERPGFEQDEFIDDIPFPETQAYVKRILGTADDYRRLYAGGGVLSTSSATR